MANRNFVYELVTNRIIDKIKLCMENGTCLPWQQPWDAADAPMNHATLKKYRGVNLWLLEYGHEYVTFNQICDLQKQNPDVRLRKGSKAHMVVFFSFQKGEKEIVNDNGVVEKQEVKITLDSPDHTVARVGIPKFGGKDLTVTVETGDTGVAYESQDSKYVYYLAQPGHHCFVGK
jgi:hypothetical protein